MKISVSSYSFQQYIRSGRMTQLDCIAKAKEMGFDAIEFTDLAAEGLEAQQALAVKLREEAQRVGMEINAYTIGACLYHDDPEEQEREIERLLRQVDVAHTLGARVMRHDVLYRLGKTGASRSFDLMLPTVADGARRVTEYAQSLGIRTCTENHGFIAQDSDRVERLFCAVGHDNYGLLVDIGNFLCADEDPVRAVSRVAPYAVHVHVKDFYLGDEPMEGSFLTRGGMHIVGAVLGEGVVPIGRCLDILKRADYDGYVSLEYEGMEDCLAGIARGLAFLKSVL